MYLETTFYESCKTPNKESHVELTWSHAKAENVGEDAGHAQVRHPGYIVLFACGEKSQISTVSNARARRNHIEHSRHTEV